MLISRPSVLVGRREISQGAINLRLEFACSIFIGLGFGTATMKIEDAVNIDDLRRIAKRHLPRIAFDFVEGGVEDEHCLAINEASFARHRLLPRYLVEDFARDQSAALPSPGHGQS